MITKLSSASGSIGFIKACNVGVCHTALDEAVVLPMKQDRSCTVVVVTDAAVIICHRAESSSVSAVASVSVESLNLSETP